MTTGINNRARARYRARIRCGAIELARLSAREPAASVYGSFLACLAISIAIGILAGVLADLLS